MLPISVTWWKVWSCHFPELAYCVCIYLSCLPHHAKHNMGQMGYQAASSPPSGNTAVYFTRHSGNCSAREQVKWAHLWPNNKRTVRLADVAIFYFTQIVGKKSLVS